MDKPYAQIKWKPLAAPLEEMEEIVLSALIACGFGSFNYTEHPKRVHATRSEKEIWENRHFNKDYVVEIKWKEDVSPPAAFKELALSNPNINAVLANVQLKSLRSNDQIDATERLQQLWKEIRARADETTEAIASKKSPSDHGTAQWASLAQLIEEDYVQGSTKEEISSRLILGSLQGQVVTVPKRFTEAHAVVQGPPGSGKSRTIFNTQLIERLGTSAIVTEVTAGEDLTPTVYGITAGYRVKNGHRVYYLNPADLDNSTRFNPIDFIDGIDDAIYYADLIITNTTFQNHVGDQIWAQSEHHLLTALLLYAWGLGGREKSVEGGKSNLGHIRSLLRLGPGDLGGVVAKDGIPEAKAQFHEFLRNSSPNFRLGVFSGLIQRLNPWLNPRICALTEVTDFDPEELRDNLFTFYLAYPVHRRDYRPIMSLALNFLTRLPLRTTFKYPMTYLLDEFAAYGRIPGIDDMQATIRNRQIGIVFGFQDLQQLTKVYSQHEAEVIFTNCDTKVTFATGSPKAQAQISQLIGQTTKIKKTVSSSGHIHRQTYGAPLLSPADVGRIPNGQVLVVRNKRNPILLTTCDSGKYEHYSEMFPLPQGKPKAVTNKMYYQCTEAKNLVFSPAAAQEQIQRFELGFRNKIAAFAALNKAKRQHAPASHILELQQRFERASAIYVGLFGQDIATREQRPAREPEGVKTTRGLPSDSTPSAASPNFEEKSIQKPYEYFSATDQHTYDYVPDSDF